MQPYGKSLPPSLNVAYVTSFRSWADSRQTLSFLVGFLQFFPTRDKTNWLPISPEMALDSLVFRNQQLAQDLGIKHSSLSIESNIIYPIVHSTFREMVQDTHRQISHLELHYPEEYDKSQNFRICFDLHIFRRDLFLIYWDYMDSDIVPHDIPRNKLALIHCFYLLMYSLDLCNSRWALPDQILIYSDCGKLDIWDNLVAHLLQNFQNELLKVSIP